LSKTLTGSAAKLTPRLIGKMNVLRGLDLPASFQHHTGPFLGNNTQSDQGPKDLKAMVSIDQVMAHSASFYGAGDPFRVRDMNIVNTKRLSWTYQNPMTRTGVQQNASVAGTLDLFQKLFGAGGLPNPSVPTTPVAQRKSIVDRVIANYRSLRTSNRRLSHEDRLRLDAHIAMLAEVERKVAVIPLDPIACGSPSRPSDLRSQNASLADDQYLATMVDVLAAGFACGASRVGTMSVFPQGRVYGGNWHQEVAHMAHGVQQQQMIVFANQRVFEQVFVGLASRLDGMTDPDGSTVLDNSLLVWGQESGHETHEGYSTPIVTAGSAGGFLKTGRYCDFRNQVPNSQNTASNHQLIPDNYTGFIYGKFLVTALAAMGVPRSEWQANQPAGKFGYGDYPAELGIFRSERTKRTTIATGALESSNDPLPLIS
jgi:Protein of unknown function (DUF1552)